ncbi:hypothetical protein V6N12_061653 [Hibiscus sabdariffa]|uniref:Uncharacterized protein n=1 Tax=Hibiscus sabdariffa TaxID=183260 RepID=A0ABR2DXQ5_9ROSI
MAVGDVIVSDNPSNGDHPAVNSTVDPAVNIVANVASVNLNSNGVNSMVDTSNGLPTSQSSAVIIPSQSSVQNASDIVYSDISRGRGRVPSHAFVSQYTPVYYSAQLLMPMPQSYHQLPPSMPFPQQHLSSHVVYGTQSPPVFSSTLSSSMGPSISSSPQAHIVVQEIVVDNTWTHGVPVPLPSPCQQQISASSSQIHASSS